MLTEIDEIHGLPMKDLKILFDIQFLYFIDL